MATFLVGPDDKTLFKSRTTWDFPDALENASDGDTIELQSGFNYIISEQISIKKNLTILGHFTKNEAGNTIYNNSISNLSVKNDAHVTLKDLCVTESSNEKLTVFVEKNSILNMENVLVQNSANVEHDSKYLPLIRIINGKLNMNNVTIKKIKNKDYSYYVDIKNNSELNVSNSYFDNRISLTENSKFSGTAARFNIINNNSFSIKNSTLYLKDSYVSGGYDNYPSLVIEDSKVAINNCVVKSSAVNALYSNNSNIDIQDYLGIDSINLIHSNLNSKNLSIRRHLFVKDESVVNADLIGILGINDGLINFSSTNKSNIKINKLLFGKDTNPNIRLERNVDFKVPQILYAQFDAQNSDFIFEDNFSPRKNDAIQYFGEKSALEKLDEMIGIQSVKDEIKEFIAITQMNKKRADQGIDDSGSTLHSLFLGNPGTGKTTVARIVGKIFYQKGIIPKDIFVETSRSDLVEGYIGQTALKTKKVLESALGGVLFIDEAYTLYGKDSSSNDFGKEAIDEILKFMEDHRSDIVIIFAGYTKQMMEFLEANPGLKSRIPNRFTFEDYSEDELIQMGLKQLKDKKYKVSKDKYAELVHNNFPKSNDNSNGRWVRNLNEKILRKTAVRLIDNENADLSQITDEDLEKSML